MAHDFSSGSAAAPKEDVTLVVAESSQSFVAFDQWMDAQLSQLVARWIHTAAPNANRREQTQRRFGR